MQAINFSSASLDFFGKPAEVFFPVGLSEDYGEIVTSRKDVKDYEPGLASFIHANLESSGYFIDVGAQIGLFSILAALSGTRTISLEMRSSLVMCHYKTLKAADIKNWTPLNFAADASVGIVPYTDDAQFALVDGNSDARTATDTVVSILMDDLLPLVEGSSGGLIKMDIEGFEVRALSGAQNLINKTRPIICIECHPHPAYLYGTSISAIKQLLPEGYKMFSVGDHRLGMGVEVSQVTEVLPIADNFLLLCVPQERQAEGIVIV